MGVALVRGDFQFSRLIEEIETELSIQYLPGAIKWSDEEFNCAWSNALERFDKALSVAMATGGNELAKVEGEFYRATILDLITKYKNHKKQDEISQFIQHIKN